MQCCSALPSTRGRCRSLKNLLDWTVGGGELNEKPAAWVNVTAANRGQGAQETLAAVLGYVGAVVIESASRHIPVDRSAIGSDGMVTDPRFGADIAEVWANLVRDAGQGAGHIRSPSASND